MDGWKSGFLLGWFPGRCYISLPEGNQKFLRIAVRVHCLGAAKMLHKMAQRIRTNRAWGLASLSFVTQLILVDFPKGFRGLPGKRMTVKLHMFPGLHHVLSGAGDA